VSLNPWTDLADTRRVAVDTTLQDRWERERALRVEARLMVPFRWQHDPRPEMRVVADSFAEALVRELKLVR
jgi:hypothetical protein